MFSGPDNPKSFTSPNYFVKAVRRWQTRFTAALTLLMITAVLSATAPAQTSQPAMAFGSQQTVLAAGIYDFFSFLGFGSKQDNDKKIKPPVQPTVSIDTNEKSENVDLFNSTDFPQPSLATNCAPSGITRNVGPTATYQTIQSAVNAATASGGDTIQVAAGTYTEQLVIGKCVTIIGDSRATTIIKSPTALANSNVPNATAAQSIVEINGNYYVTMSKLTVTGPVAFTSANNGFGIFVVGGSTLNLSDAAVTDVREDPIQGNQRGLAIAAGRTSLNQIGSLILNNVSVSGYQKGAIYVDGQGSTATINNVTVTGQGPTTVTAQNGVQISRGATGTVTNSTINGNSYVNPTGTDPNQLTVATGIIMFNAGAVSISNNTLNGDDAGIYNYAAPASTTPPTFTASGNTITGNAFANLSDRYGIYLGGVNGNISNNFIDSTNYGLISFVTDNTVTNLTSNSIINSNYFGIFFGNNSGTPTLAQISAHFNRIANNGSDGGLNDGTGLYNGTNILLDATDNFYGCNAGPNGGTGCDTTVGPISLTPYLVLQASASPTTVNTGGNSTVMANLTHDNTGADTSTSGLLPNGIPISFATTFGSVSPTSSTLTNGLATTTFTGGTFSGNQTAVVTSTVDNANTPVSITVNDTTPPTVVIAVANGQPNPTSNLPINFTVTFSDAGTTTPVITGFDASDIVFSGTADTSNATVTVTDLTNGVYNVAVSGIVGNGNVDPYVKAGAATDPANNPNTVSNTASVNYISPAPRACGAIGSPYNLYDEFSIGSNPNCEYTYGYTPTADPNSAFTKYLLRSTGSTPGNPNETRAHWYRSDVDQFNVPGVFKDTDRGALLLHPGLYGERTVVRFTVGNTNPSGGSVPAGFYKINGSFMNGDNATTDVSVILRRGSTSTVLFSGNINGTAVASQPFDIPVTLADGDAIDFSVGYGNGNYSNDSTLLSATITSVALTPETLYGLTPAATAPVLIGKTNSAIAAATAQNLVSFSSTNPNTLTSSVGISGLGAGETLVGIDFRPRNGVLYAVSSDGSTGRVYTINASTGAATAINGGTNTIRTAAGTITLSGINFGVDFNPAADRIRLVSDSGQNLRINPDTGVTVVDGTINPAGNTITAAAYTNNVFPAPASTMLYDIDASNDTLYTQTPPNNGTLVAVGPLGVDASAVNGFDISGATATPYASFTTNNTGSTSDLYTINLTTGTASRVGKIGTAENSTTGLSVSGLTVAPATIGTDATFPTVTSISRVTGTPTKANSVDFTVTFSEAVNGVDAGDFALATTGVAGASITSVTPTCTTPVTPCATYTVTVNTGTGDGAVGLNLVDNDSIVDPSRNALGGAGNNLMMPSNPTNTSGDGSFTGDVYTIDKTTPTIVSITSQPTSPTNMSPITFTVTFSETLASCNATGFAVMNGTAGTPTLANGNTCTVTVAATGSPVTLTVSAGAATDPSGNSNTDSSSLDVVYDVAAPTVTIVGNPPTDNTSPVNFTVTFSEFVTGFDASDVSVTGTAFTTDTPPSVIVQPISRDRTTYDVAVRGMNITGEVIAKITGSATDASGNASTQMPSATVQYNVVDSPVTVNPTNTKTNAADSRTVWTGFNDNTNQFIDPSYVEGPGAGAAGPPLGTGSARLNTTATGKYLFASGSFNGTPLSQITELSYSSYAVDPSNAANLPSLQIGIDYDSTDNNTGFQGRLVFVPADNQTSPNQVPAQGQWQRWNATNGRFWFTQGPGTTNCGQATPCTLGTIIATYQNINIPTTDPISGLDFGFVGFRSTGGGNNAVENYVDAFTIGVNSANTTFNFEAQPPTISISDSTVAEGDSGSTTATFTVTQSVVSQLPTTVTATIGAAGDTATLGTDYTIPTTNPATTNPQTLTIPAGQLTATVTVNVIGDTVFEGNETYKVSLSNAANAAIVKAVGVGTITDDDTQPSVQFNPASYTVTEGGTQPVTVTRTGALGNTVTVKYDTSDGSATAGSDYTAATGTLTFNPGVTSQTFTVATSSDTTIEGNETVNLTLSAVTGGAVIGNPTGLLTITDGPNGGLSISGFVTNFDGTGGVGGVTVTLSGSGMSSISTTTTSNGSYSFNGLASRTYLVTPSSGSFAFEPLNRSYNLTAAGSTTGTNGSVSNANFTAYSITPVNTVPRKLTVGSITTAPGVSPVTVPVTLTSLGNENGISFTLDYDETKVTPINSGTTTDPVYAACGADAPSGCTIGSNIVTLTGGNQVLTVELKLSGNNVFAGSPSSPTNRQAVVINFNTTAVSTTPTFVTPLILTDNPTGREINDVQANPLPAQYINGQIAVNNLEADVTPRQTGNGMVTLSDAQQISRFVARLDTPSTDNNEFQRADCAPLGNGGDGRLTTSDSAQARRYAAGLDASQPASGPLMPVSMLIASKPSEFKAFSNQAAAANTTVRIVGDTSSYTSTLLVTVAIDAAGNENGLGFSIMYDPTKLSLPSAVKDDDILLGTGAIDSSAMMAPADLTVNTQNDGMIGILLQFRNNRSIAAGSNKQLVQIRFKVIAPAKTAGESIPLTFTDNPVFREVVNPAIQTLDTTYTNGNINILGSTAASAIVGGRVTTAKGGSLGQTVVTLSDGSGRVRSAVTNSFGNFRFENVPAGASYIVTINSKRYTFAPQVVNLTDSLTDLKFTAAP